MVKLIRTIISGLTLVLGLIGQNSCADPDDDDKPKRDIRAHTLGFEGVGHPIGNERAEHYCKYCHGENLSGGVELIPSCYQCHGKEWSDSEPNLSLAPEDHTVSNGGFMHQPSASSPVGTCDECHGSSLGGDLTNGRPSCFLCHDQKWD